MIRATTGGVLRSYRSNLMNSFISQNNARDTVLSQRNFNSYAEDPSSAAKAFRLRKSRMTAQSQYNICNDTYSKYQSAFASLQSIDKMLDTGSVNTLKDAALQMIHSPTGDARQQLNKVIDQISESIVQNMNQKYGENFIFAGADGHNVPFEIRNDADGNKKLYYREIPVDADTPEDLEKLEYLKNEKLYVDIGLGFQENENGELIASSAFNAALAGINFFGYGVDEDGDPKNIFSLVQRMKEISESVPEGESWDETVGAEFNRLIGKLETASSEFKTEFANMDAGTTKLKTNLNLLEDNFYNLQEQYADLEDVDMADAITSFVWAQYCYNAALKVGNSVLSESLMDYLS